MMMIAIETVHQWAQKLPLRDNILVCIGCGQVKPLSGPAGEVLSCSSMRAWQHYGDTARGDFWVTTVR